MSTTLKVEGMSCGGCVSSVTKALKAVPGVKEVAVSLEKAEAVVEGEAAPEALAKAIEGAGFGVAAHH